MGRQPSAPVADGTATARTDALAFIGASRRRRLQAAMYARLGSSQQAGHTAGTPVVEAQGNANGGKPHQQAQDDGQGAALFGLVMLGRSMNCCLF